MSNERARAATEVTALLDGSLCFRSPKFTLVLTELAPGAMLVHSIGYNTGESAPLVTAEMVRHMPATGKLQCFVNLSKQTGQSSAAREWWGAWAKQHRPSLGIQHILVTSKVMEMAISVLSMIVGGGLIKAHSSLPPFEAAITERVPGFRKLPTFTDLPPQLP